MCYIDIKRLFFKVFELRRSNDCPVPHSHSQRDTALWAGAMEDAGLPPQPAFPAGCCAR